MKDFISRTLTFGLVALGFVAALALTGCGDEFFDENAVVDVTVDPSSIPKANTGMTDQYFTIEVSYRGFDGEISDVEVFIENPTPDEAERAATIRDGSMQMFSDESRIVFETAQSWFSGVDPGTYSIGARVVGTTSGGLEVTSGRRGLAQVTITE
jgi:hypothetical protein